MSIVTGAQPVTHMPATSPSSPTRYEAETIEGLEQVVVAELTQIFRDGKRPLGEILSERRGAVEFAFRGPPAMLNALQTPVAVYMAMTFPVPRPKALLGHQHFTALVHLLKQVMNHQAFGTLGIDAAGADSSVMLRLKAALAEAVGLRTADDRGDLLLRLRRTRSAAAADGWDALVRLTPRPLATREWRVCNYEGALNATVAQAMARLSPPTSDDRLVNLMAGSGSLLIERLRLCPARQAIGCDLTPAALRCAEANLRAAGLRERVTLLHSDVRDTPLATGFATHLMADLPFGQLVGTHRENQTLYPLLLREAARIARTDAGFAVITHEIRLFEALLRHDARWRTEQVMPITLGGLHPRIYLLRRTASDL